MPTDKAPPSADKGPMLTPADLKKLEHALPSKATAIIQVLRKAGLVAGEKLGPKGDRGAVSPLGGEAA